MEVIKIPQEHVDSCLFFRPGGEGGRLPGRCTVLSARRTAGRESGEKEDLIKGEGAKWTDVRGVQSARKSERMREGRWKADKRGYERERHFDMNEKVRQMNVEALVSCA